MHYYKRNIGDYAKKAGRLSMLQHGAYTLLIDACYDRELFPTLDEAIEWTWASTTDEIEAVQFVLRKFFNLVDGIYVQNHIKEDLDEYHATAERNKQIALAREEKRRLSSTTGARDVHETPPNHKPLTINQEPLTKEDISPSAVPAKPKRIKSQKIPLPAGFTISDAMRMWAKEKNFDELERHFESFVSKVKANGYTYVDWDAAFRNAVSDDWAKIRSIARQAPFSAKPEKFDPLAYVNRNREPQNAKPTERDITGEIFEMVRSPSSFEGFPDGPPLQST